MAINSSIKQLQEPDLSSTLKDAKRDVRTTMNCINIGIIQEFNSSNQTATIRMALKQVDSIAPDGTKNLVEHPLVLQCPVYTMFGGQSFINMPIAVGDTCIVFFGDREIDNWLYNGGVQTPTTPRTHDISDAIALVGIKDFQHSIASFLANGIRIWFAANSKIDLTENAIDSLAGLFTHTGNFRVDGDFFVTGVVRGENDGAVLQVNTDITQTTGRVLKAGNGVTGTFSTVTVADGIVTGGS